MGQARTLQTNSKEIGLSKDYEQLDKLLHNLTLDGEIKNRDTRPKENMDNLIEHAGICGELTNTYRKKNADYGNSFSRAVEKYGLVSALTRISDKFNRLESLILHKEQEVKDESVQDTLLDLANYCIMTVMEIRKNGIN